MDESLHIRLLLRGAPGPKFRRGTPRRAEPSCRPYSMAEFAAIVEKANTTGSSQPAKRPEATVAMNTGSHPDRPFLQVRRYRPEPIPWGTTPPQAEEVCAYDRGPDRRPWPSTVPTSDPPRLVFPPPRLTREKHTPSVAPYLASIDTTLKEMDVELTQARLITPYIDRVTRVLERLEQPVPCRRPHLHMLNTRPVQRHAVSPHPPYGRGTHCIDIFRTTRETLTVPPAVRDAMTRRSPFSVTPPHPLASTHRPLVHPVGGFAQQRATG